MALFHKWNVSGRLFPRSWHRVHICLKTRSIRVDMAQNYGVRIPLPPRALLGQGRAKFARSVSALYN